MMDRAGAARVARPRVVTVNLDAPSRDAHEIGTLEFAAGRLAALFARPSGEGPAHDGIVFYLPGDTLCTEDARALEIAGASDFWGGIVPHPFVATKLVSHPLVSDGASSPPGWTPVPGIVACTLPGYSVFSAGDALEAAARLLEAGPFRVKAPHARGGHGQVLFRDLPTLEAWLAATGEAVVRSGFVLELDLPEATTYSIGSASLRGMELAYHGQQRLTFDRYGQPVYGGSRLRFRRGDLAGLQASLVGELSRLARLALAYDHAVGSAYGVIATRRNYDVIAGLDARGLPRAGVLEQSWRFGGASMAEILAFEHFHEHPQAEWVTAETVELHDSGEVPAGAIVHWPGDAGSPCKYARIVDDGC